jgi:hypothetical protein
MSDTVTPASAEPESSCQEVTITDAKAPFDNPDAEVIIRSSDNVDFRVFKSFLLSVSTVFKDMFAIPQGPADAARVDQEMKDGRPIIPVTEESQVVETLLRFCFPNILTSVPVLNTMEEIMPVLEVSIKYGIEILESRMRDALFTPPVIEERAMQLFVVAYRHRWEKEIRIAAKHTLVQPAWDRLYVAELESITGGDLHRLQKYRLECARAAKRVATTVGWIKVDDIVGLHCNSCEEPTQKIGATWMVYKLGGWWVRYMRSVAEELAKKPRGDTVLESSLVDTALHQANRCQRCRARLETAARFKEFCEFFAAEVDRVISQVSYTPSGPFCPLTIFVVLVGHPGDQVLRYTY